MKAKSFSEQLTEYKEIILRLNEEIERLEKEKVTTIERFAERAIEATLAMVWSPEILSTKDYADAIKRVAQEMAGGRNDA